jgi:thymidylate synthase ThyX
MTRIILKLSNRDHKGYFVFHNGFKHVSTKNLRTHKHQIKEHQFFLNQLLTIKKRKLFESIIENDWTVSQNYIRDFVRIEFLLLNQHGYTGIIHLNNILMQSHYQNTTKEI